MIYSLATTSPKPSAVLFLHSPPLFPPPSPLLGRANSWGALLWQDKSRDLTPFLFISLVPNGNVLSLKKSCITLCDYQLIWCGSGPWLRRIGSFLHVCWLFHKPSWNSKAIGKGSGGFWREGLWGGWPRAHEAAKLSDVLPKFYKKMDHEVFLGSDSNSVSRVGNRPCSPTTLEAGQLTWFLSSQIGEAEAMGTACHAVAVFSWEVVLGIHFHWSQIKEASNSVTKA